MVAFALLRILAAITAWLTVGVSGSFLTAPLSPGSSGIVPYIPVPTKYTITLLVTLTVIMYTAVNLFRRFYLERYERDEDGKLYPVECRPTRSLVDGLFSLSAKWGIVKPPLSKCTQKHLFAGWAHAFVQCGRFWRKLGDGLVTITHYPEADKHKIMMKNACDVVMINHELTRNMALFRDENQGVHISRWSAIDFASMQPRSETFCLRWNHLGSAETFNQTFYKCTQPASYTDNDIYPLNAVPAGVRQMDLTTQWPAAVNNYAQTAPPPVITPQVPTPRPLCPMMDCDRQHGEPLYDMFTEEKGQGQGRRSSSSHRRREPRSKPSRHESTSRRPARSRSRISRQASRAGGRSSSHVPRISKSASRMGRQPSRIASNKSGMVRASRSRIPSKRSLSRQSSRMAPQKSSSKMGRPSSLNRRSSVARQPSMSRHSTIRSQHSRISPKKSRASRKSVYRQ